MRNLSIFEAREISGGVPILLNSVRIDTFNKPISIGLGYLSDSCSTALKNVANSHPLQNYLGTDQFLSILPQCSDRDVSIMNLQIMTRKF